MLKKVFLVLVVLIGILAIIPAFMSPAFEAEASESIKAPPAQIFATVATLQTWKDWTVWNDAADPKAEWSYEGPKTGLGSIMKWSGEKLGVGQLEIVKADPQAGIAYTMNMEGMAPVHGEIRFTAKGDLTEVVWHDRGELGYAFRLMGPMLKGMLVDSFRTNLGNLKERLEAPKSDAGAQAGEAAGGKK